MSTVRMYLHTAQDLARADFEEFCTAANNASLRDMGVISCPSCGALIERRPPVSLSLGGSLAPLNQAPCAAQACFACLFALLVLNSASDTHLLLHSLLRLIWTFQCQAGNHGVAMPQGIQIAQAVRQGAAKQPLRNRLYTGSTIFS